MSVTSDRSDWTIHRGEGPTVATAVHDGHRVRPEVEERLALSPEERRREEDPYTSEWTEVAATRVVVHRSRFEVDMNRPRDEAVYQSPAEAWGLDVWRERLPPKLLRRSLDLYDDFYREVGTVLEDLVRENGRFVVYDLHSYNHRRKGPRQPPDDPRTNPEINLGTSAMPRERWAGVLTAFMDGMKEAQVMGRPLDVRENVRFHGGYFSRWVHETFPETGCCLAIEVKKFYMDEWTGEPDEARIEAVRRALASTVPAVVEALETT